MFRGYRVTDGLKVVLTDSDVDQLVVSAHDGTLDIRWHEAESNRDGRLVARVPGLAGLGAAVARDEPYEADGQEMTLPTRSGHRLLLRASAFGVLLSVVDALGRGVYSTFIS